MTLAARHAVTLLPKAPSCGNQPAYISLTARRNDTLTRIRKPAEARGARPDYWDGRLTLPLDMHPYISVGRGGVA